MQSDIKLHEGWVFQDKVPARAGIDLGWWHYTWDAFPYFPALWWNVRDDRYAGSMHGTVRGESKLCVMCRVEHYPAPVESPDDWVPQKSIPARPEIDQRRYVRTSTGLPVGQWEDSACMDWGRPIYFGAEINDTTVELRCRRSDHPDYQAKAVEPQSFRKGDLVRFRGGMITFLVAWVAKDGMVRLADHSNPAYWCKPETLELVSRVEGPYQW